MPAAPARNAPRGVGESQQQGAREIAALERQYERYRDDRPPRDPIVSHPGRPLMRPAVYQPELPAELIHQLWLLKQQTGRPMTVLLREAVERFLSEPGIDTVNEELTK